MQPIFQADAEQCRHPRDSLQAVPDSSSEPCWPIVVCIDCGCFTRSKVEIVDSGDGRRVDVADGGLVDDGGQLHAAEAVQPVLVGGVEAREERGLVPVPRPALAVAQEQPTAIVLPGDHPGAPKVVHAPGNPAKPVESDTAETDAKVPDVVVRALVDLPPFVDARDRTLTLKAGDIASVSEGIAQLLQRRGKAAIVEEVAA